MGQRRRATGQLVDEAQIVSRLGVCRGFAESNRYPARIVSNRGGLELHAEAEADTVLVDV